MTTDKITLPSGSTRSADVPLELRYDLIPHCSLRRLARRYGEGAKQHGDNNWRRGQPLYVVVQHLMEHLYRFLEGDHDDDHLAAAAWGCFALMWYEEHLPEMINGEPAPDVAPIATPEAIPLGPDEVLDQFMGAWNGKHVPSPPPSHGPGV